MSGEEKDPLKPMEWKGFEESVSSDSGAGVVAKRIKRRIRHIPKHYFLPRRYLSCTLFFYGSCIAGGIGAGMLTEIWINKKVIVKIAQVMFVSFIVMKEDGGVIREFDK